MPEFNRLDRYMQKVTEAQMLWAMTLNILGDPQTGTLEGALTVATFHEMIKQLLVKEGSPVTTLELEIIDPKTGDVTSATVPAAPTVQADPGMPYWAPWVAGGIAAIAFIWFMSR